MNDKEAWIRIYETLGAQFALGDSSNRKSLVTSTDYAFKLMKKTLRDSEFEEKING